MTPGAILSMLAMMALLGGVVLYGMNQSGPTAQLVIPIPTSDYTVESFEDRLYAAQTEEEAEDIIVDFFTHPKTLQACVKLWSQYEPALAKLDLNNQKSKDKVLDIYTKLFDLGCIATMDQWKK